MLLCNDEKSNNENCLQQYNGDGCSYKFKEMSVEESRKKIGISISVSPSLHKLCRCCTKSMHHHTSERTCIKKLNNTMLENSKSLSLKEIKEEARKISFSYKKIKYKDAFL